MDTKANRTAQKGFHQCLPALPLWAVAWTQETRPRGHRFYSIIHMLPRWIFYQGAFLILQHSDETHSLCVWEFHILAGRCWHQENRPWGRAARREGRKQGFPGGWGRNTQALKIPQEGRSPLGSRDKNTHSPESRNRNTGQAGRDQRQAAPSTALDPSTCSPHTPGPSSCCPAHPSAFPTKGRDAVPRGVDPWDLSLASEQVSRAHPYVWKVLPSVLAHNTANCNVKHPVYTGQNSAVLPPTVLICWVPEH